MFVDVARESLACLACYEVLCSNTALQKHTLCQKLRVNFYFLIVESQVLSLQFSPRLIKSHTIQSQKFSPTQSSLGNSVQAGIE